MKKDYKTLFNNLITSKIDELIIKYDSKKDNYTCLLYTSPSPRDRG